MAADKLTAGFADMTADAKAVYETEALSQMKSLISDCSTLSTSP